MRTIKQVFKTRFQKGVLAHTLTVSELKMPKLDKAGEELRALIINKFGRSFHIREVDTGSCGACESEIIAAGNPIYDIQQYGVDFVASPRHADALLVTGPVSKNMALALKRTYDAMPEPKIIITAGDCALDGGPFKDAYYVENGVSNVLPVAVHIPGCPPNPYEIVKALLGYLKKV